MKPVQAVLFTLWFVIAGCATADEADASKEPASIAQGQSAFTDNCAACHGASGAGDGIVASVLKPTVPDLTALCAKNDGVFPAESVYKIIDGRTQFAAHGTRLMPIWGMEFWLDEGADERADVRVAEKIHQLVAYLETLALNCTRREG
ncbi:MAG: cytochrome c [Pseudomonadota bacterium]